MCGIACIISSPHASYDTQINTFKDKLLNRGPDCFKQYSTELTVNWNCQLLTSVLHTQGTKLTEQPLVDSNKNFLLWNGDVFDGPFIGNKTPDISDTAAIFLWLEENDNNLLDFLTIIEGPYAFVFYDAGRKKLWFGRDPVGRHSLLWKLEPKTLLLTSVGHKNVELAEVPAIGIFFLDLSGGSLTKIHLHPWSHYPRIATSFEAELPHFVKMDKEINYFDFDPISTEYNEAYFQRSMAAADKLKMLEIILENCEVVQSVSKITDLLTESCRKRVTIRTPVCKMCVTETQCSGEHAKVGILFSGGLDSTIIAFLADKFVPTDEPIDLINVAFGKKGRYSDVPDRKTGLASYGELSNMCPQRLWNFIEVNVLDSELQNARSNHICHLIHPLKTVLDDSLGCALWFACRGSGHVNGYPFTSTAKIILLGNGADEQFGGYTRHRNILKQTGWADLDIQLMKETLEISKRNLGRDDRIASDNGRQPRFPFLDEQVIKFAAKLPAWKKCGPPSFPPGVGDKLILRLVAVKLGLKQCSTFPKRAFQFGCRIANSKEKGQKVCNRL